jgi:ribosome-associated protein
MKRESHALQSLGEQLLALPDSHLKDLAMPERLREAIVDCKKMKLGEGRRRQMQFIGKLMRDADPEPLREAVAAFELGHARNALALHQAERWRADLITDDKSVFNRWMDEHSDCDVQRLRTLIRNARKDAAATPEQRNGRAFRELFQFIKEALALADAQAKQARDAAGPAPEGDDA